MPRKYLSRGIGLACANTWAWSAVSVFAHPKSRRANRLARHRPGGIHLSIFPLYLSALGGGQHGTEMADYHFWGAVVESRAPRRTEMNAQNVFGTHSNGE